MYTYTQIRRLLPLLILLCAPAWAAAQTCSREDIEHYLQRGFTHDQVTKLCGNAPLDAAPVSAPPAADGTAAPSAAPPPIVTDRMSDDLLVLKSSIEANDVQVTPTAIVYRVAEHCVFHGTENHLGLRDRACLPLSVTIARKGLRVTQAREPLFLIREGQFIVASDVERRFDGLDRLNRHQRAEIETEYPVRINEINVPFRKRADLNRLKETFERLAD
ncbi:MAG: hypothetical protein ACFCUJ_06810 [Thiotrichales bacterium]